MTTYSILSGLEKCPLRRNTPFGFENVSKSQLSLARHSGAIMYNGERYLYSFATDELIREDVLKWKNAQPKKKEKPQSTQQEML